MITWFASSMLEHVAHAEKLARAMAKLADNIFASFTSVTELASHGLLALHLTCQISSYHIALSLGPHCMHTSFFMGHVAQLYVNLDSPAYSHLTYFSVQVVRFKTACNDHDY